MDDSVLIGILVVGVAIMIMAGNGSSAPAAVVTESWRDTGVIERELASRFPHLAAEQEQRLSSAEETELEKHYYDEAHASYNEHSNLLARSAFYQSTGRQWYLARWLPQYYPLADRPMETEL